MAWFFGRQQPSTKPDYTGLELQTATSTLPIPIVWGRTKIACNVIFYSNFQTQGGQSQGKGGLFGSPAETPYSYSADLVLALCEGPIGGVGWVWRDQSSFTLAQLGLTLYDGTTPQAVWPYLSATYPSQALAYQGTAFACAASYQLGDSADIGNHNFEVLGMLAGSGVNGIDADPAQVIYDFLTNAQYGAGFNPASINLATLYGSSGDASLQTYCKAMGIAFSPALTSAEQGSSILTRWLQIVNCAAIWSGGELKFIPYGDAAIAAGNVTQTVTATIPMPAQQGDGDYPAPSVLVCSSANWISDGGVAFAFTGAALTYTGSGAPGIEGGYGISTNGTYLFNQNDSGKPVVITFTSNNPSGYVPNLTPVYSLTDLDFVNAGDNKDPVQVQRVDPFSLPTIQRVEVSSRDNQYGAAPVEARDQSQIELFGPRVGSAIEAHEICDEIVVGPVVAQTILQRQLYVRARFTFKLSWEYCLLDPMDIVTITDANLGLDQYPVRITAIEEDDKGLLTIHAEELVIGVSTPATNPSGGGASFQPNQAVAAAAVNAPLIYEPPPALTNNMPQVWLGASSSGSNWGGAFVWASVDNSTYSQIAKISTPLRQGLLTNNFGQASGWDIADTLSITVIESKAQLTGTSAESAKAGATLSLVDYELLAYETATLTGSYAYSLTGLQRGLYGSAPASHSSGAPFARLDGAVVKYNLPSAWIGVTIYLKFQSFNVFGGGVQDLSSCAAYSYTPNGDGRIGPVTQALLIGAALDFGGVTSVASESDTWGNVTTTPIASVDLGTIS